MKGGVGVPEFWIIFFALRIIEQASFANDRRASCTLITGLVVRHLFLRKGPQRVLKNHTDIVDVFGDHKLGPTSVRSGDHRACCWTRDERR